MASRAEDVAQQRAMIAAPLTHGIVGGGTAQQRRDQARQEERKTVPHAVVRTRTRDHGEHIGQPAHRVSAQRRSPFIIGPFVEDRQGGDRPHGKPPLAPVRW